MGGRVAGIIANQPMFQAGAMDTDGLDKVISFLCLCDSFNIPIIFFHDIPGFLVGKEAERRRVEAKVMNGMNALALTTVPKISIIVRKTYGQAFWNMGGTGTNSDFLVAWPTAEISFVDPEIAANVVFGGKVEDSGDRREQLKSLVEKMVEDSSPYAAAGLHYLHDVIDPRQTRDFIIESLEICQDSRTKGMSQHKLASWPTKF
jgi:methylmalonyl-CoA decarboxylase subunit alpha